MEDLKLIPVIDLKLLSEKAKEGGVTGATVGRGPLIEPLDVKEQ